MRLVRKRGQYMQEAVPVGVGAMAAVLKLPAGKLDAILAEASQGEVVTAANYNSPDQVVIAGHAGAVTRAVELAKAAGAKRALLLPVSAPFHCPLMEPAQQRLKADLDATEFRDLAVPLVNGWQARRDSHGSRSARGLVSAGAQPGPVDRSDPQAGFARRQPLCRSGRGRRAHRIAPQHRTAAWKAPNLAKRKIWRNYMRQSLRIALVLAAGIGFLPDELQAAGCAGQTGSSSLTDDFVYGSLALSPVGATAAGYHEHKGVKLDEQIDDFSAAGIDQQHKFYSDFHNRLAAIQQDSLSAEDRADYQIIDNQVNLSLLELDKIQSYRHNPTVYVELVGNALFNPFVLEYAPLDQRYRADYPAASKDSGADAAGPGEPHGCAGRLESRGARRK